MNLYVLFSEDYPTAEKPILEPLNKSSERARKQVPKNTATSLTSTVYARYSWSRLSRREQFTLVRTGDMLHEILNVEYVLSWCVDDNGFKILPLFTISFCDGHLRIRLNTKYFILKCHQLTSIKEFLCFINICLQEFIRIHYLPALTRIFAIRHKMWYKLKMRRIFIRKKMSWTKRSRKLLVSVSQIG